MLLVINLAKMSDLKMKHKERLDKKRDQKREEKVISKKSIITIV